MVKKLEERQKEKAEKEDKSQCNKKEGKADKGGKVDEGGKAHNRGKSDKGDKADKTKSHSQGPAKKDPKKTVKPEKKMSGKATKYDGKENPLLKSVVVKSTKGKNKLYHFKREKFNRFNIRKGHKTCYWKSRR